MRLTKIIVVFLLVISIGTACKQSTDRSIADPGTFDLIYQSGPKIRPGTSVDVWIKNLTSECIGFPADFGLKIYLRLNDTVVEVPNLVSYIGDTEVNIKPEGDIFSQALVYIQPDLSGVTISQSVEAYAVATGHICSDENRIVEKEIPFTIAP